MAVFFFVVGLEVKRELLLGELRDPRAAVLPVVAALGGMVVPALLYLAVLQGAPGSVGWGIPMATDIAFVVGCLALLGPRVPNGLRVLLLSLAIADDLGAILIIAFGYSADINLAALVLGLAVILAIWALVRLGVTNRGIHLALAIFSWACIHESGIHATITGVILGLVIPAHPRVSESRLGRIISRTTDFMKEKEWQTVPQRYDLMRELEAASRKSLSPLERFEHELHPWVAFAIMPLFALANAGVLVQGSPFASPVAIASMAGLVLGKPLGVLFFSWLAVKTGLARLPQGVNWQILTGGGFLCGIGFTMALFIASLALEGSLLDLAKVGVLIGSALCALAGMVILHLTLPHTATESQLQDYKGIP
jgi:NhaA family Na+:H+ antiporter